MLRELFTVRIVDRLPGSEVAGLRSPLRMPVLKLPSIFLGRLQRNSTSVFARQFARPKEHCVKHGFGKDAGKGVLLGGVVAAKEDRAEGDREFGAMRELWLGTYVVEA